MDGLTTGLAVWILCVVLFAGLVQGTLGFGFPFIATPLIALASDMRTAIIAVALPTLATVSVALFASGPLRPTLRRFWMMPLYHLTGAAAGTWLFVAAPGLPYLLVLAIVTLLYLNLDRLGRADWPLVRRHERRFAPFSGFAGGLFEGTANVAAPPLIIFYLALGLAPAVFVQALNICFFAGKATQILILTLRGGVTLETWAGTLPFLAVAVAGSLTGVRLRNRIDAPTYRAWVKRGLFLISLALLAQYGWMHFA